MDFTSYIPENYTVFKEENIINNNEKIKLVFIEKINPLKVYYDKNKEKISKQKAEKYKEKYTNDEEYREKLRIQRKEYYSKNKLKKELKEKK